MEVPLEIAFHNLDVSESLERRARQRADKLHRYFDGIVSCRVLIEVPHRNPRGHAKRYHVRVEVGVPNRHLVVSRDPGNDDRHFDAHAAVNDAFEAMEKQLEDYAQRLRGEVGTAELPPQGRVLRLFRDHGFIATTDGQEIYFHRNSVVDRDFDDLEPGDAVELAVAHGESAAGPQATTVRRIRPATLDPQPRG